MGARATKTEDVVIPRPNCRRVARIKASVNIDSRGQALPEQIAISWPPPAKRLIRDPKPPRSSPVKRSGERILMESHPVVGIVERSLKFSWEWQIEDVHD